MFLLVNGLVCFGWISVIAVGMLCAMMAVKMIGEKVASNSHSGTVCVEFKGTPNIAAIERENVAIDAICKFYNIENGYCDMSLGDRMMLQKLYDEFVDVSKERNDGKSALSRDILNYRVGDSEARSKLLENLMSYLALRKDANVNLLQHRTSHVIYK